MSLDDQRSAATRAETAPSRQRFLQLIIIGMGSLVGVAIGFPVLGFLFSPLVRQPSETWQPVGKLSQFKVGQTVAITFENSSPLPWSGATAKSAAWLRRGSGEQFVAFSINCTHLGCPVRWEASSSLFFCPCHGGVYYGDGNVAAGPPPQPLPRYPVRVQHGRVEIRTSPFPITTFRTGQPSGASD